MYILKICNILERFRRPKSFFSFDIIRNYFCESLKVLWALGPGPNVPNFRMSALNAPKDEIKEDTVFPVENTAGDGHSKPRRDNHTAAESAPSPPEPI